jgi:hypothetical protein
MSQVNRSVFRRKAVEYYIQNQEKQVLPRYISPQAFAYWWLLLLLFMISAGVIGSIQLPMYLHGHAIVKVEHATEQEAGAGRLIAFLPASAIKQLTVGQAVLLSLDAERQRVPGQIITVERQVLSPQTAQQRFMLTSLPASTVTQPVAVVIVQLAEFPAITLSTQYAGGVYSVEVEVGVQRLISLVPWFQALFTEAQA